MSRKWIVWGTNDWVRSRHRVLLYGMGSSLSVRTPARSEAQSLFSPQNQPSKIQVHVLSGEGDFSLLEWKHGDDVL